MPAWVSKLLDLILGWITQAASAKAVVVASREAATNEDAHIAAAQEARSRADAVAAIGLSQPAGDGDLSDPLRAPDPHSVD